MEVKPEVTILGEFYLVTKQPDGSHHVYLFEGEDPIHTFTKEGNDLVIKGEVSGIVDVFSADTVKKIQRATDNTSLPG